MVLIRVYAIFWWSNPAKPSMHIHAWYEPNLGLTGQFLTGTKQPAIDDTIFGGERSLSNQLFEKPTNWEAVNFKPLFWLILGHLGHQHPINCRVIITYFG